MNVINTISHLTQFPIWAVWLIAAVVLVLAAGRVTRLIFHDDFPPSIWFRVQWDKLTDGTSWNLLFHCPWCLGFWATVGFAGWFALGLWVDWIAWAWWIVSLLFALGYLVPMVIARDEPSDD